LPAKRLKQINPVHSFRHYAEFRIMPSCLPVFDRNAHLSWFPSQINA